MRLGGVKKSQQTKSNPLPPAVHVTIIMIINIHSAENIIDDLECDELKAPLADSASKIETRKFLLALT